MKKFFIIIALFSTPAYAQDINYYAKDFPKFYAENPGSEVERAYNAYIKAAEANAKVLAKRKVQVPVVRVEGTIVVQVRVDDGKYRPVCSYGSC